MMTRDELAQQYTAAHLHNNPEPAGLARLAYEYADAMAKESASGAKPVERPISFYLNMDSKPPTFIAGCYAEIRERDDEVSVNLLACTAERLVAKLSEALEKPTAAP